MASRLVRGRLRTRSRLTRSAARSRAPLAAAAVVAGALAAGCGGDLALRHDSDASETIANLWLVLLIGSTVIFAIVVVLLAGALGRRRRGPPGEPQRGKSKGAQGFVVVAGIVVPAVILAALFVLTVIALPKTSPPASADDAARGDAVLASAPAPGDVVIDVLARRWFWDVEYPASGVRTANEIHIPVGERALVRLRSGDVIHSLWVPELNRKVDAIPGHTNSVVFEAVRAGVYEGRCAEFCGLQHAHMGLHVVAEPPEKFAEWLEEQARPAPEPATPELRRGQQIYLGSACVYCHTISGTNSTGRVGPDLTHLAGRLSLAAGTIPNTRGYLAGWIVDPQHLKPGNLMPGTSFDGPQLQALLDYLESLR